MRPIRTTRRKFLGRAAAAGSALPLFTIAGSQAAGLVLGANERIRVGIIGAGDRGRAVLDHFLKEPDVQAVAACDVYQPYLDQAAAVAGAGTKTFKDFRRLLELKDVDAVIVGTPDHWHAIPTILACEAGKDVYVEKPLSLRIREGRRMVDAARKHGRIVQTGSQQRSGAHYARARELVRSGKLGTITHVSSGFHRNAMPGFAAHRITAPPEGLDWDLWLGPAPFRATLPLTPLYHFRYFWDYSGGQMTNFGAHDLDIVRWIMGVDAPEEVAGFGGRFVLDDGGETPDVQQVIFRFPRFVLTWSVRETSAGATGMFLDFHGTQGTLSLLRSGFRVVPEQWSQADDPKRPRCEEVTDPGSEHGQHHVRNFLDCVKSRARPNADVEDGHRTATLCHLGNIATRTGKLLRWDAAKEEIIGDAEANRWLDYEYRKPWTLG